jgi:uncharacterized membrane protein
MQVRITLDVIYNKCPSKSINRHRPLTNGFVLGIKTFVNHFRLMALSVHLLYDMVIWLKGLYLRIRVIYAFLHYIPLKITYGDVFLSSIEI